MQAFIMCSLPQNFVAHSSTVRSTERCSELSPCPQILRTKFNSLSLSGKVSTKPTLHSWIVAGNFKVATWPAVTDFSYVQLKKNQGSNPVYSLANYDHSAWIIPLINTYLLQSLICHATQTHSTQRKSATATIQRSDPKGKLKGPKLDDGSGGFPPFRFGKGGGGGGSGGGGSNYFGGFLLFTCVLLMDYLKELEKTLLLQRHRIGDEATAGLAQ